MKIKSVFKSKEGQTAVLKVYDSLLERWPVPYEAFHVDTCCGNTYVIASGLSDLPPLLLLHGTSSNLTMWIGDIEEYSRCFRVFAIDIPGEPGKSGDEQYPLEKSIYQEWLRDVFQKLELKRASLIGISLGAWMAIDFSAQYPEMVEKLVVLSPSGIGPQKNSFLFKSLPLMLLGERGFMKITRLVNGDEPIPDEAVQYSRLISQNFNLRSMVPVFFDDELKRLTMPLLLFAGGKDVLLNSRITVERISKLLPKAETNLIPEAGHVLIHLRNQILHFLNP
jgi:pimeloyl-ACP methyl ester carboxylesterase